MYAKNVSKFWDGNKRRASAYFPLVLPKNLKCSPSQFNSMGKVKSKSYNMISPNKKNDCISYQIETDLHVWTRRRKHQMRSIEQKLHQRDITTKWPNHMYISLCDSQEKEIENEMKWNELVKSSQFLVWNLCYHCIRRPKVQWFYFLIFNIHLDCFSLRSSIIIKANDHSTLSESIFDYAAWKGTTILRTK